MIVTITATLDPTELIDAAVADVDVSCVGDHDSEYEVVSSTVEAEPIEVTITLTIDRVSGKFASKDVIEEVVRDALGDVEGLELS